MATRILLFLLFFFIPFAGMTQTNTTLKPAVPEIIGTLVETVYYEGDTIPYAKLGVVTCSADRVFKNYRQKAAWDRLKYNVKKVYPYAILASAKLKEYARVLATIPSESGKKAFMKLAEKQLKKEFSQELKNLSVNQGRILIKLIDRETGKTTYDIVKNMRGSFSAAMWQGVAIVFNSSLKSDYDAEGEEKNIELAIRMIEDGQF